MRLKDRTVLITGSTTGIGAAAARLAVAEGARVVIHGRSEERARALAAELGPHAGYHVADLAGPAACEELIAAAVARFGRLDGLVNNAASTRRSTLATTTAALFDDMMAVNLRAPLLLIRASLPHFRAAGGGAVVNIGSINAYCGEPHVLAYSISKGGLMTLTRSLGDSLGVERVRVNQLNVGWTTSENELALKRREGLPADWPERVPPRYAPFGRLLTPENVAEHIVFWLSDASAPASGSVVDVEQYPLVGRLGSYGFED